MPGETRSSRDDEALQATATRLVEVLGFEDAIFVCRSNYWYGVLRLIKDQQAGNPVHASEVQDASAHAPGQGYKLAA